MEQLASSPYGTGNVKALSGDLKWLHRLRVGDYWIICQIIDTELVILVLDIGDRKNIYR